MKAVTGLVYGIGFNDGKYPSRKGGKKIKEYALWMGMLSRCYSKKFQEVWPTYIGCSVSENFKSYSFFYEWCQEQIGFKEKDFHLDKDICFKGNKVYSEDTCYFVPRRLNFLLIKGDKGRGIYPVGVCFSKFANKFVSCCNFGNGRQTHLGYFNTPKEAFLTYKKAKETYIKQQAEHYKDAIHPNVYKALLAYEVHEND